VGGADNPVVERLCGTWPTGRAAVCG